MGRRGSVLRALARRPGFTAVTVLILAVGIGASTSVFSVADTVLLRPLSFPEPDRLVRLEQRRERAPDVSVEAAYPDVAAWDRELEVFDGVAAWASGSGRIVEFGESVERVPGKAVTWNFFRVLGVEPLLGRTFRPEDGRPGAAPVVVLHEDLWRRTFGADPAVLGRMVRLEATPHEVIGVVPAEAEVPVGDRIWTPVETTVPPSVLESPGTGFLNAFARLAPTVSIADATGVLEGYLEEVVNARGFGDGSRVTARLTPFDQALRGESRGPLLGLLAATLLLLLLTCANVAGLQLVRALDRRRDEAVRVALGATSRDLSRRVLVESGILAGAGAALGVALAALVTGPLVAAAPVRLFRGSRVEMDPRMLLFGVGMGVVTALLAGWAPAAWRARVAPQGLLRATGVGSRTATRVLSGLVVLQVSLASALVLGGGVLARSLQALHRVDKGFEAATLTVTIPLFEPEYDDDEVADRFFVRLADRLAASPEVEAAGGVLIRPLETSYGYDYPFTVEGRPPEAQASDPYANYQAVTPGYLAAMGIEVVAGRGIVPSDDGSGEGVVVVGETMARRFWQDAASAVGGRLKFGPPEGEAPWLRVVGVVEDTRQRSVREGRLDLYVPAAQSPWKLSHLAVRTRGDPAEAVARIRRTVAELDPGIRITGVATMGEMVSMALARPRYLTLVVASFALVAFFLAALGLYGVLSYGALLRRREMGLRLALGARPTDVRRLILGRGLVLTGIGLLAGGAAFGLAGPLLNRWLYGVGAGDPATIAGVVIGFGVSALAAGLRPALRAGRVEPDTILRAD